MLLSLYIFNSEINGVTICYKMGNIQDTQNNQTANGGQNGRNQNVAKPTPSAYPNLNTDEDHDYEILAPGPGYIPVRPAPPRPPHNPTVHHQHSTHTLTSNFSGLEGVPFVINPKFLPSGSGDKVKFIYFNTYLIRILGIVNFS